MRINFKEWLTSFFIFFLVINASAQPELEKLTRQYQHGSCNELLVLSDVDNPIQKDKCRKMVSELTLGNYGLWSRYHFEDASMEGQWYKNFCFLKVTTPVKTDFTQKALYDVTNKMFPDETRIVDNKQYVHLSETAPYKSSDYLFIFDLRQTNPDKLFLMLEKSEKDYQYVTTKYIDGINYLYFLKPNNVSELNNLNIFKFKDTDFINEDIPDKNVNTNAKYLLLQRDYKLGGTYNTVIFPVDVPVKEYNHLYNDGMNRMIVYRLVSANSESLHFVKDQTGVLKANTPYVIKSQSNDQSTTDQIVSEYYLSETPVDNYDINRVQKVMGGDDIQVFAQYRQYVEQKNSDIKPEEDIYIVANNELVNCRNIEVTKVNRFRWYIKRPHSASATPITMTFDDTTGIDDIKALSESDGNIYDLTGKKCGTKENMNALKGYYIVDGKVRLLGK